MRPAGDSLQGKWQPKTGEPLVYLKIRGQLSFPIEKRLERAHTSRVEVH